MNQIDLRDQCAVVTGGARGIGYAIADRLLRSGAVCCLWDRDRSRLADTVSTLSTSGTVHAVSVDISRADSVQAALQESLHHMGRIDILVNNAGIAGPTKTLWDVTPEEWQDVLDVNLTGVFLSCRAVVPQMIEHGYGRIVNIASIAGKEGNPNASPYSVSKAGVIGLTKSLGKELATMGVAVNAIAPAVIDTEILRQVTQAHIDYMLSKIPMARVGKAEEVAALAAWLASRDCSFSTGAVYDLSGGRATY